MKVRVYAVRPNVTVPEVAPNVVVEKLGTLVRDRFAERVRSQAVQHFPTTGVMRQPGGKQRQPEENRARCDQEQRGARAVVDPPDKEVSRRIKCEKRTEQGQKD